MAQNTPAPWHNVNGEIHASYPNQNGPHIATVWAHGDRQTAANALLNAAAPDLLAALVRLDRIERGLEGWHEDAKPDAWLAARAAIAKAEGTRTENPAEKRPAEPP